MALDTKGIVASASPNNEAMITTSAEDEAGKCFNRAHDFFLEYKAAGNISSLNTAIDLLDCAASSWPPGDTGFSGCLNHLATALLIRFIYTTENANDVLKAYDLRRSALGYPVQGFLQSMVQDMHEDVTSNNMMTSAVMMLKEFLQAHSQATLENSILLYQEGLKLTAETHFQRWRMLWELSDALLIQFHHTGNLLQLDEAISCLKQVKKAKANWSICLFASLITGHEGVLGHLHQAEATGLAQEVVQNNQKAQDLMQLGQGFLELFKMDHDSIHLNTASIGATMFDLALGSVTFKEEMSRPNSGLVVGWKCHASHPPVNASVPPLRAESHLGELRSNGTRLPADYSALWGSVGGEEETLIGFRRQWQKKVLYSPRAGHSI
ncbi:hypothetical protein B0H11DRAFT_1908186 [Mycena galericulata]|nr:hypothetical protein B0H11DRAFT_1908186 [Mycena galericulata]